MASKKPKGFGKVEQQGKRWLEANPQKRPQNLWSPFQAQLAAAFKGLCAYGAMHEPNGTVDHFVSIDEDRSLAYAWLNYRYCAHWINASKKNLRASDLLDPFEVRDGWFEISLPSLQLVASDAIPKKHRVRAERMLTRLHLGHDERVMKQRRAWMAAYEQKKITLEGLFDFAPLIARAIVKRQAMSSKKPRAALGTSKPPRKPSSKRRK